MPVNPPVSGWRACCSLAAGELRDLQNPALYQGHFHDLLNDVDKGVVMTDILTWIDARIRAGRPRVASLDAATRTKTIAEV